MPTSVMIIDDSEPMLLMTETWLSEAGFKVIKARNGKEALEILKTDYPDVVIADLQMQPVGGFEFAREMSDKNHAFPIILVTGDPSTDVLFEATRVGISQVLRKPVSPKLLVDAVERALR